jgi:hypothetical protein
MDQEEFIRRLNVPNLSKHSEQEFKELSQQIDQRKKENFARISIKDDEIGRYTIEEAGELIKQYPISRETFNHIMSNSETILSEINKAPVTTFVNPLTPVILKASLNRLEGLTLANNAIARIPNCSVDTPIKEAMLLTTKKGKIVSCVASHMIIGEEPRYLSFKNTKDLYKFCHKSNFVDVQPKNFVACTDKIFLIDTGLEGFDEESRPKFKGFISDYIRYKFKNRIDKQGDDFLISKMTKHNYYE